ncbi:MAG TPA: DNA-processing protein DprA, partial [Puia sp.]|nr:DNA-processing protein DprA [Puia sp.]
MEDRSVYQLALRSIRGIGDVHTRTLIDHFGDAESVFRKDRKDLEKTGLRPDLIDAISHFRDFASLRPQVSRLQQRGIRILFYHQPDFPRRLAKLSTAPALLYYQGNADLNAGKVVAVVGTRKPSPYGVQMARQITLELARPEMLIVSGLAFGIDAIAHQAALDSGIPTVGVLGTGLERIYPPEHTGLAQRMQKNGGLLSSFRCDAEGATFSFPLRNRLVAGLCDALIVVESGIPGGSLSAAETAAELNKNCFAVPGRLTDEKSRGCLKLIHEGTARPLLSATQLCGVMGWNYPAGGSAHQPELPLPASGRQDPLS